MILLACPTQRECAAALCRGPYPQVHPAVVGVGPVAAAAITARVLAHHPVRGVLHLGIAGSFDLTTAPVGAIVVATKEIWPEYGVRHADGTMAPLGFPMLDDLADPILTLDPDAAAQAMGLHLPEQWIRGAGLTGAGVTGDPVLAARLHCQWQAITESMEGFGVALAARLAGVPLLQVRSVSNAAGERDKRRWDVHAALAALGHVTQTLCGHLS